MPCNTSDSVVNMDTNVEMREIVLRDLQSLLRQWQGQTLIVDNYTSRPLLPPGENYGSTILSVHAVIRRSPEAKNEELHFIAKMPPPTEYQRQIFDSPYTFRKEIAMYEEILPGYNQLEREAGLRDEEIFDVLPKYFGSRLSLDPNVEFNDDAVILLDNLKVKGYYTGKRHIGYDVEHSKVAIRAMARFHALGIAMKNKKPEIFEKYRQRSKSLDFKDDNFDNFYVLLLKKVHDDPEARVYSDRCEKLFKPEVAINAWTMPPNEPWATIIHSDFWVNNILFHRGEDGKVDDVKFVDFQNYVYFSPIRELLFYIFSSIDDDAHANHLDELISFYHETFIDVLTQLGCNTECFTREKFDAQMPEDAGYEFLHLCFMLKVLTLDTKETEFDYGKIQSVMKDYEGNKLYGDRLRRMIVYFAKRNWI